MLINLLTKGDGHPSSELHNSFGQILRILISNIPASPEHGITADALLDFMEIYKPRMDTNSIVPHVDCLFMYASFS
jgi:hypothetical protein